MRPIKNNIFIDPIEYTKSKGGLFIKATSTEKLIGKVIAVGDGTKKNPMLIRVGDTVQYRSDIIKKIENEGETVYLLNEAHVIAIL